MKKRSLILCLAGCFALAGADLSLLTLPWKADSGVQILPPDEESGFRLQCTDRYAQTAVVPFSYQTGKNQRLQLVVRSSKPGKVRFFCYFATKENPGLSEKRKLSLTATLRDGWNTISWEPDEESGWQGEITAIRFDVADQPGALLEFKTFSLQEIVQKPGVVKEFSLLGLPWQAGGDMKILPPKEGAFSFHSPGNYAVTAPLPVKVKAADYRRIQMQLHSSKAGRVRIFCYFATKSDPAFSEKQKFSLTGTLQEGWNTLRAELDEENGWQGTITAMRFDFADQTGADLEIKEWKLLGGAVTTAAQEGPAYSLLSLPWQSDLAMKISAQTPELLKFRTTADYAYTTVVPAKIQADRYNYLEMDISVSKPGNATLLLYFTVKGSPALSEKQKIYAKRYLGEGVNKIYIPLQNVPAWKGDVRGLRFDIGTAPDTEVEIHRFELTKSNRQPDWEPGAGMGEFRPQKNGFRFRLTDDYASSGIQPMNLPAEKASWIRLKVRSFPAISGEVRFFFSRPDDPILNEKKYLFSGYRSFGEKECVLWIDASRCPEWKGTISGMRIDFAGRPGSEISAEDLSFEKECDLLKDNPSAIVPLEAQLTYTLKGEGSAQIRYLDAEERAMETAWEKVNLPAEVKLPAGAAFIALSSATPLSLIRGKGVSDWQCQWITHPDFAQKPGTSFLRKTFRLHQPVSGRVQMTVDDQFILQINGKKAARNSHWASPVSLDVTSFLRDGENEIMVECGNDGGPGGMIFEGRFVNADQTVVTLNSDASWQCGMAPENAAGKVQLLGPVSIFPWGELPHADLATGKLGNDDLAAWEKCRFTPADPTVCTVGEHLGRPSFMIDGKPVYYLGFQGLGPRTRRQMSDALRAGVEFVNGSYIGSNHTYASGSISPYWKGIGEYDWESLDRSLAVYAAMRDDVKVIVSIGCDAPAWWADQNPSERVLLEKSSVPHALVSPASLKWRPVVAQMVRDTVEHIERSPMGGRVIGYRLLSHCDGGEFQYLGGWIDQLADYSPAMTAYFREFLRQKYGSDRKLQEAWNNPSVTLGTAVVPAPELRRGSEIGFFRDYTKCPEVRDYWECHNECMAQWGIFLLKTAKEAAPGKLAGLYGGYVFTFGAAQLLANGHLNFNKVFDSGYLDFVSGPQDYDIRRPGRGNGIFMPYSSLALRKIKCLDENDARTHLGIRSLLTNSQNLFEDISLMKRDFLFNLCHDAYLYFYDMGETWFSAPELTTLFGIFQKIGNASLAFRAPFKAKVAVFYSAESAYYLSMNARDLTHLNLELRDMLSRAGVPFDTYLLTDLLREDFPADQYRCCLFMNTFAPSEKERRAIGEKLKKGGKTLIFGFAPGAFVNDRIDLAAMKGLTGFDFTFANTSRALLMKAGDEIIGGENPIAPAFTIEKAEDAETSVLGRYCRDNAIAAAKRKFPQWTSICSLVPQMSVSLWKGIFREAGCHVFCDTDDPVWYNGRFVGIHAATPGEKIIRLPQAANVYDLFRRKLVAENTTEIKVVMQRIESNGYFLGTEEEWRLFLNRMNGNKTKEEMHK